MPEKPNEKSGEKTSNDVIFNERILAMTAQIVAAHAQNNNITDFPSLIATVYQGLVQANAGAIAANTRRTPAVPIRRSITDNYIICLDDGKKLKMLKRHLKTSYNLTPDQYRERWGLDSNYPMVAPNYAKQRSKLAKQIGLGTARRTGTRSKAA